MWKIVPAERAVPFLAVMYPRSLEEFLLVEIEKIALKLFKPVGFQKATGVSKFLFGPVGFSEFTNYYDEEIGGEVGKIYVVLPRRFDPSHLAGVKLRSNRLERMWASMIARKFSWNSSRPINLDPGYLTASKLILASTKNYFHRIYLGRGIYAEVTLFYRKKSFQPFEWTYPDYAEEGFRKWLKDVRNSIKDLLF